MTKIANLADRKKIAHPSTNFLSLSDIVFALDLGEKIPSYPSCFNSGRK